MKAVILLSGGLDSTVILAKAVAEKKECIALGFDYGQRHRVELEAAKKIADYYEVPFHVIPLSPDHFNKSALVSGAKIVKKRSLERMATEGIPNTYVPARNTLFLAYALGIAEMFDAEEIHFGCNAMDHAGYPDCRPAFVQAFQNLMSVATKQAVEGNPPRLITPLLHLDKFQIAALGNDLGAPIEMTHSCYDPVPEGHPCKTCDACVLRLAVGF